MDNNTEGYGGVTKIDAVHRHIVEMYEFYNKAYTVNDKATKEEFKNKAEVCAEILGLIQTIESN